VKIPQILKIGKKGKHVKLTIKN